MSGFPRSSRLERLRRLATSVSAAPKVGAGNGAIPPAEPLPGDWPAGCQAYPASFAQSRLWFLHQLQPGLTAYHMPALWRLRGALDTAALQQALASLIERHPTLRTSFHLQGNEVLQVIHQPGPVALQAELLGDRDAEKVIAAWLEEEGSTPFDLTAGLLMRARLLQLAPEAHLLLLNHHHIASDGWSRSVLASDLVALYNAHRDGRSTDLPSLSVHYQDYAVWQRQRLRGSRLEQLQDYWISQMEGIEPLELPADHPRPATPSYRGGSVSFQIEPSLLAPFEELCRAEGATLQMGLLALVALLLHRYSRQDDFAIGIPIWGRNHPDLENLIGFFINTLPIRTRFEPEQSFRQLLQQVRSTSLEAYDHQELPFEQMVEALQIERDTSRNPLVQVMLQLIELPGRGLQGLDALDAESLTTSSESARFELEFFLRRSGGGLRATVNYATDLFEADRIARLTTHLQTLLASLLEAPEATQAPAGSLNLLPASEQKRIESWQQGPEIEVPDLCVHQLFEQQVERTPDVIALIFQDQQLTYNQLNARANQLAHHLIDLGVGPEVIVAVCLERSVELIVALLAILKAGGAYLPLDPSWPEFHRQNVSFDAGAQALIDQALLPQMAKGNKEDCLGTGNPHPVAKLSTSAYLLYTSGSTGTPKGVMVPHRSLTNLIAWHHAEPRLRAPARTLQFAACIFDVSLQEVFVTFTSGGCLILLEEESRRDVRLLWQHIANYNIERLFLPYVALEQLAIAGRSSDAARLLSLRDVVSAGSKLSLTEPIRALMAALPECRLHNHYGPTESHVVTSHLLGEMPTLWPLDAPIGKPIGNVAISLLNPAGKPSPIGIPGELHIGGAGLARGYLNNPELTTEKFIPDPFSADPTARLYKTGDLAAWNPDGTLAFHGRIDQQIKLRGFRIEPGEIEANLLAHPAVAQVVVLLREDDPANPRLIAYWVPLITDQSSDFNNTDITGNATTTAEQLRSFLIERLPDYMVPAAFVELQALPLTKNGKLDRKGLPAPSFSGDLQQQVASLTALQVHLHAIWTEVLGHSDFGITDNFFLMGGHSLAAARLVSRIEHNLGLDLPVASVFRWPNIAEQAEWLSRGEGPVREGTTFTDQGPGADLSNLVTLQPLGERLPLFVIHGWGGSVGGFIDLARALAPHRPVLGLQADNAGEDFSDLPTVKEIAARYTEQILARQPDGPIHLLGYSAGGWYAHAVAAALLERGVTIGMIAILDTSTTAIIHRRVRLALLVRRLLPRLRQHGKKLLVPPADQRRRHYLLGRLKALNHHLDRSLGIRVPRPARAVAALAGRAVMAPADSGTHLHSWGDTYADLLQQSYRPPRLPVVVDLFAPPDKLPQLKHLWHFYARAGVRPHPLFRGHYDFFQPELMPRLAEALEEALSFVDAAHKT